MIRRDDFLPALPRDMLLGLTIRDVVLIERLDLAFRPGLCVLTGETGAGKSILLDALGLALGARAESGLVRKSASQAMVTAEFALAPEHRAWRMLDEQGIAVEPGETLMLRRTVGADGRSRAFVNDQPTSVGLLKQLGDTLVEIQGQFEQRGLLDPATHRGFLDAFGGYGRELGALSEAWRTWRDVAQRRTDLAEMQERARRDEEYLRHALAELEALGPAEGEEAALAEKRAMMQHRERLVEALTNAAHELSGDRGAEAALHTAMRLLERVQDRAAGALDAALAALDRATVETREAGAQLEGALREIAADTGGLERIEERLFALRALARKHSVQPDELPRLRAEIGEKIAALDDRSGELARLAREEEAARRRYGELADAVTGLRSKAADKLDVAVMRELKPLKLEKARFRTMIAPLDEREWGDGGKERVRFEVATNPGTPPGPLARIASGGELSRFLLALKVVLSKTSPVPTLVFDEVDSGIGGAVAAAVGERLQRLGEDLQVLVVTHSPQVAAKGAWHWRVAKDQRKETTLTRVEELSADERREEIARMLSGSTITAEARAAADSLIAGARE